MYNIYINKYQSLIAFVWPRHALWIINPNIKDLDQVKSWYTVKINYSVGMNTGKVPDICNNTIFF